MDYLLPRLPDAAVSSIVLRLHPEYSTGRFRAFQDDIQRGTGTAACGVVVQPGFGVRSLSGWSVCDQPALGSAVTLSLLAFAELAIAIPCSNQTTDTGSLKFRFRCLKVILCLVFFK